MSGRVSWERHGQAKMGSTEAEFALWGIRRELFNPVPGRVIDLTRNAGGIRTLLQRSNDCGGCGIQLWCRVRSRACKVMTASTSGVTEARLLT